MKAELVIEESANSFGFKIPSENIYVRLLVCLTLESNKEGVFWKVDFNEIGLKTINNSKDQITSTLLHLVPVAQIKRKTLLNLRDWVSKVLLAEEDEEAWLEECDGLSIPFTVPGRGTMVLTSDSSASKLNSRATKDDEALASFIFQYNRSVLSGEDKPSKSMATLLDVSTTTIHRWLKLAESKGYKIEKFDPSNIVIHISDLLIDPEDGMFVLDWENRIERFYGRDTLEDHIRFIEATHSKLYSWANAHDLLP